jgi:hypothetical protein
MKHLDRLDSFELISLFETLSINGIQLYSKKDITAEQIPRVASKLVKNNVESYHNEKWQLVYNTWISSQIKNTSLIESIVTAFDAIFILIERKDNVRLPLRFAYLQLIILFSAVQSAVAIERQRRNVCRSNTSIILDIYLSAKGVSINDQRWRHRLSKLKRIGQRLMDLAPSPIYMSLFTDIAETIVYVYSFSF